MYFSELHGIQNPEGYDWFDPILDHDTKLFLDPFLIFKTDSPIFAGAHGKIVAFFEHAFMLAAGLLGTHDPRFNKLVRMVTFPEVHEICLGYSENGVRGSGSGAGYAKVIAAAIQEAISSGIRELKHFEETELLQEGIGCDRISDTTANILLGDFVKYTQEVCNELGISMELHPVRIFDDQFLRWQLVKMPLPTNPFTGRGLILVPKSFVRELPTINSGDFRDYLWDNENDALRNDFNYEVKDQLTKREIVRLAHQRRDWVRSYLAWKESQEGRPYDLRRDPYGVYQWDRASFRFVSDHPLSVLAPTNPEEFTLSLRSMLEQFRLFVEDNAGYRLLWNDGMSKPKKEEASQLLFLGVVKHYCRANKIDISRETNIGRGPVDFKFSNTYCSRALLEVKLAKNSRFWHGLHVQLPEYLRAEEASIGLFVAVAFTDKEMEKIADMPNQARALGKQLNRIIEGFIVDARPKASASHL